MRIKRGSYAGWLFYPGLASTYGDPWGRIAWGHFRCSFTLDPKVDITVQFGMIGTLPFPLLTVRPLDVQEREGVGGMGEASSTKISASPPAS